MATGVQVTCEVDYGDGSAMATVPSLTAVPPSFTISHTYTWAATFSVTINCSNPVSSSFDIIFFFNLQQYLMNSLGHALYIYNLSHRSNILTNVLRAKCCDKYYTIDLVFPFQDLKSKTYFIILRSVRKFNGNSLAKK